MSQRLVIWIRKSNVELKIETLIHVNYGKCLKSILHNLRQDYENWYVINIASVVDISILIVDLMLKIWENVFHVILSLCNTFEILLKKGKYKRVINRTNHVIYVVLV